jgi:diguanylate cyclase (GGDEF)-like protein
MTDFAPHIDLLTGAYLRPYLEEELAYAVAEAKRGQGPLSIIHIDVDDLQEHNDLFGRATLDQALSALVSTIASIIDGQGPIGRLGGDEFAVLLLGVARERATRLAERIRLAAAQPGPATPQGLLRLTVSVGVASLRPSEPLGNLLEAAEEACRRAKQSGRNSVVTR